LLLFFQKKKFLLALAWCLGGAFLDCRAAARECAHSRDAARNDGVAALDVWWGVSHLEGGPFAPLRFLVFRRWLEFGPGV
jgi:hypothetical protein